MARRFAEAVEFERRAVELRPDFGIGMAHARRRRRPRGRARAGEGRLAEARRLHPSLSAEWVETYHGIVREEDRAMYVEGLRAAGLG